jgi:hypothetical protein
MQSAHWALFNVSADQHVLRCVRVTDAADSIVEICDLCRVGARYLIHLFIRLGTAGRIVLLYWRAGPRAYEHDARPDVERVRRGRRGVNSVGRLPKPPGTRQQIS